MRTHTEEFKKNIIKAGRELKNKISYTLNGELIELADDDIFSIRHITNGTILKSVMKTMEIELKNNIPLNTILNHQFGVKVGEEYEYINFGDFIVTESEKVEETGNYKLTCYDKMIYSMIEYEDLNITYPITIKNYLNTICNKIGLDFENYNETFANHDKLIQKELYLNFGYTFRDVLDEIAQVTASTICINENGKLEVRYINNTGDSIDENILSNINVTFKEKYGPINSIVFSRSAGSDNIYLRDEASVEENGLCEIKIKNNEILNLNNRDEFLSDILNRLNGLEFYTNDFSIIGLGYLELCDKYDVIIGDMVYPCVLLNDDITITAGMEEEIYTEKLTETQTDYTKSDKTDRRINQTYLIVDKQNQTIESVVSQTNEQNQKIAKVTQTVDELNSKISDIADITVSAEDTDAQIEINEVNQSEPIRLVVRPIVENISYLYPSDNLYPSDDLFMKIRTIRFHNKTTNEDFDYELPDDLLYYDSENYDEFILDYDGQSCVINKKVGYNADGTTYILENPKTVEYPYPRITLSEGDYELYILSYSQGYIFARLMAKNIYTTQFYTKAEVDSEISQTAQSIDLSVDSKLSNYSTTTQMNSAINIKANEITSSVSETYATKSTTNQLSSRISQTAKTIELTTTDNKTSAGITIKLKNEDGTEIDSKSANITLTGLVKFTDLSTSGSTTINGSNITTGTLDASKVTVKNLNASNITSGTLSAGSINLGNGTFSVTTAGKITSTAGTIGGWNIGTNDISNTNSSGNKVILANGTNAYQDVLVITDGNNYPFVLRANGYLSATNAVISGTINSINGSIGGWSITNEGIRSGSSALLNNGNLNLYPTVGGVYRINNGVRLNATSGVQITSNGGSPSYFNGTNIDIMGLNGASVYIGCKWGTDGQERSAVTCADGALYLSSAGAIYANGVQIGGSSSKATKENIVDLEENQKKEVYQLIRNIPLKQYDYKKQYGKKINYGFIIEDIENTKLKDLLHITQNPNNQDIKNYSSEDLARLELVVIQEIMKKIENLEEQKNANVK